MVLLPLQNLMSVAECGSTLLHALRSCFMKNITSIAGGLVAGAQWSKSKVDVKVL
jgi:hypothetical protein